MLHNLIAFTIIFTIFSIIIFSQVQNTLFSQTDEELLTTKKRMTDSIEILPPINGGPPPRSTWDQGFNPRVIIVHWDENGTILNERQIGTLLFDHYLSNLELNTSSIDEITMTTISEQYHFRTLLFKNNHAENHVAYTQLLMSVDAEYTIISNFEKLIIICSFIFIVLSISASYILSRNMMKPILLSWNKQAEFVENASHELRTPLTIIQNKLEMLLTVPQERIADKFENIAISLSETRRLSKLTSDLLTLARADSAETQIVKQPIPIDSFIKKVCTPYMEIAESQDKHLWLNLKCDGEIKGDEVRLHQLLVILLDNALKYTTKDDSIGVSSYLDDQKVVIEVSDTGIGIKEENMELIFERFYREDKARSRETGGVGLGLSIAQWIVTEHHGSIKVFQNQNKGTTFRIKLPK